MIVHILNKKTPKNLDNLNRIIANLDPTQKWKIKIELYKFTRSTEQNSRLWKLYTELGQHIGHSPDEVHQLMGYKFLRELITVNGDSVEVIKSTTKLNTKQMAEYQDNIERFATEIGYFFEWI
jgi:transcription-repair coupling factor (superfamily II helicase)